MAEAVPEAHLHLAGDGDYRDALEAEVDERGLRERVTFHGHVDETEKARLLGEAWVALTASSAEGWCLTVLEAGACATPTAALRVGGLEEAIVDGQTGVLADTPGRAGGSGRRPRARHRAPPRARAGRAGPRQRLHMGRHRAWARSR